LCGDDSVTDAVAPSSHRLASRASVGHATVKAAMLPQRSGLGVATQPALGAVAATTESGSLATGGWPAGGSTVSPVGSALACPVTPLAAYMPLADDVEDEVPCFVCAA
jgi:hypothetical protein